MNHEQINAIATVLRESPTLTEVEIRGGSGVSLRLRRPSPKTLRAAPRLSPASIPPVTAEAGASSSPSAGSDTGREPGTIPLTAVVVGIFRALAGEATISAGKTVEEGQSVGHIEAMRLLNDCLAPESGTISAVLVEEGQPVEYGQLLFEIAPTL